MQGPDGRAPTAQREGERPPAQETDEPAGERPRQDRGERLTNTITFYIDCPFVAGVVGGSGSIRTAAGGHLRL